MFDLNAIVTAALNAAIQAATEPLITRIAALESANDILHRTQHEAMVAMRDRIATLETNETYLTNRIAALESAPSVLASQYTPISNEQFKAMLEEWDIGRLAQRIAALETNPAGTPATITADAFVTHLDQQEWFWHKIAGFVANNSEITGHDLEVLKDRIAALESETQSENRYLNRDEVNDLIQEAIDDHTSSYDHDEYDNHINDDDKHFDGDIEDAVRDTLNGTSVTLSF